MIPSDNPSESSTSTPTARILSADATAATHSDGQCDSDPTMPDGQCLCSMVLRPVERLVFSPKER